MFHIAWLQIFLLFVVHLLFPPQLPHPYTPPDLSFLLTVIFPRKYYIYRDKSMSYGFGRTGSPVMSNAMREQTCTMRQRWCWCIRQLRLSSSNWRWHIWSMKKQTLILYTTLWMNIKWWIMSNSVITVTLGAFTAAASQFNPLQRACRHMCNYVFYTHTHMLSCYGNVYEKKRTM